MITTAWNELKSFARRLSKKVKSLFSREEKTAQFAGFDPEQVLNPLFSGTETTPGATYQKGMWTLLIYYRNPGTRSQGQHGVLLRDGIEVHPAQPGQALQTDLGELVYIKDPAQISFLWDTTGWDFTGERPQPSNSIGKA